MPMVDAAAAGVVYTSENKDPDVDTMVISAVPGLADRMVKGEVLADTFLVSKGNSSAITRVITAKGSSEAGNTPDYLRNEKDCGDFTTRRKSRASIRP